MGKGCHLLSPQHDTGEWDHPQKLPALFMRTNLPGAGGQQGVGLGAQHHSSTPRSPFGFAWALQHRPRALCWQDEDASDGLSSFPSPSLVAMPARRATRERGGLKCLQETVRAVLLGGGAQRRLLPAVHVAGSAGLPPALPLPRSKRETSLGLHPWGTAWKRGKMLGFAAASFS